jgi:hypothetical protein
VGGYRDFPFMEDYYLWLRLLQKYDQVKNIDESLVLVRGGSEMVSRRKGMQYLKSELSLYLFFIKNTQCNKIYQTFVFLGRATARLVPGKILSVIYRVLRK